MTLQRVLGRPILTKEQIDEVLKCSPLTCQQCGELIPEERRRAEPGTPHCMGCAEILEEMEGVEQILTQKCIEQLGEMAQEEFVKVAHSFMQ